jgi:rubrerythrin
MENLTLRKAIEMAVATEEIGARYYQEIAEKFSNDKEIARIFGQLSEDEVAHEAQFRKLLEEVPPEKDRAEQGDAGLLLRAAALSQFFDKKAIENVADIETPVDALAKAMAFERSTLFYYQSIKDVLGESPQLQKMIDSEKAHVTALMKVILSDARFRGLADPW